MPVKAVLIGDTAVGKSYLYDRLSIEDYADAPRLPTIGGSFRSVNVAGRDGAMIELALWDTAGQELYRTLIPMYFERAVVLIVVYSITDSGSYEHIPEWIALARERADHRAKILLVGNKADLDPQRAVPFEDLDKMAGQIKAYAALEVSAKTGVGMEGITQALADSAQDFQFDQGPGEEVNLPEKPCTEPDPADSSCC
jgi:small GTP-binding protein